MYPVREPAIDVGERNPCDLCEISTGTAHQANAFPATPSHREQTVTATESVELTLTSEPD
jgi:hypothetical protein